jgi:hypothetical protein
METTVFMPRLDSNGAEALKVLRAIRGHIKDGAELHAQLLDDLDNMLAIVEGTSRPDD